MSFVASVPHLTTRLRSSGVAVSVAWTKVRGAALRKMQPSGVNFQVSALLPEAMFAASWRSGLNVAAESRSME